MNEQTHFKRFFTEIKFNMVNERVNIRDKHRVLKKIIKILLIVFGIVFVLLIAFVAGFLLKKPVYVEIVIENPLKNIVFAHTDNVTGEVDKEAVIEQGLIEFNEEYINYLLVALGTGYLHKSFVGENPFLELVLDEEVWHSEIIKGMPNSGLGEIENEDLRISLPKEEAIKAILSKDIEQFMKDSVANENTQIEMIAGKTELFSKGYLDMYEALTGKEIILEE